MFLEKFYSTDIGVNADVLFNMVSKYHDAIFVDLGVRTGISSEIMLINSEEKNNKVFGVDVDFSELNHSVSNHSNYTKILGDSCTVGKYWSKKINGLFIDTFHIKEQVLCELKVWYPNVVEGGFIAFHDTNWPKDKHDEYGGIIWGRPEEAITSFFNISELDYEDEYIKVSNYPLSWGMTIIEVKKKNEYISQYMNWDEVINKRNYLISLFWNSDNIKDINIDLILDV